MPVGAKEDPTEELLFEFQNNEIVLNTQENLLQDTLYSVQSGQPNLEQGTQLPTKKYTWRDLFDFDGDIDNDGILDNTELDFEIFKNFDRDT